MCWCVDSIGAAEFKWWWMRYAVMHLFGYCALYFPRSAVCKWPASDELLICVSYIEWYGRLSGLYLTWTHVEAAALPDEHYFMSLRAVLGRQIFSLPHVPRPLLVGLLYWSKSLLLSLPWHPKKGIVEKNERPAIIVKTRSCIQRHEGRGFSSSACPLFGPCTLVGQNPHG